jgi:hypothetical protein
VLGIVASRNGRSRNGRVRNGRSRIGRSRIGTSTHTLHFERFMSWYLLFYSYSGINFKLTFLTQISVFECLILNSRANFLQ